jgi:hypothetical protein
LVLFRVLGWITRPDKDFDRATLQPKEPLTLVCDKRKVQFLNVKLAQSFRIWGKQLKMSQFHAARLQNYFIRSGVNFGLSHPLANAEFFM